jgi:hypothetical protein
VLNFEDIKVDCKGDYLMELTGFIHAVRAGKFSASILTAWIGKLIIAAPLYLGDTMTIPKVREIKPTAV